MLVSGCSWSCGHLEKTIKKKKNPQGECCTCDGLKFQLRQGDRRMKDGRTGKNCQGRPEGHPGDELEAHNSIQRKAREIWERTYGCRELGLDLDSNHALIKSR